MPPKRLFLPAQTRPQPNRPRPCFVAIPTTSGTGSEVTAFSVVKANAEKLVLVDASLLPDIAILDPSLVASVPPAITADTGMDVLCHARGLRLPRRQRLFRRAGGEMVQQVFRYLPTCWRSGDNLQAREKMHNASCMAGMAFTNASLGITHSARPRRRFPRATWPRQRLLMAQVVARNADFDGQCDTLAATKYARLAHLLDLPAASPRQGVASLLVAIQALKEEMSMPSGISNTGIEAAEFERRLPEMVGALRDGCTPTNPRAPDANALTELYRRAWHGQQTSPGGAPCAGLRVTDNRVIAGLFVGRVRRQPPPGRNGHCIHNRVVISRGKRTSGEYFMAHYNLTPRVKVLADRLLAQKARCAPNMPPH